MAELALDFGPTGNGPCGARSCFLEHASLKKTEHSFCCLLLSGPRRTGHSIVTDNSVRFSVSEKFGLSRNNIGSVYLKTENRPLQFRFLVWFSI